MSRPPRVLPAGPRLAAKIAAQRRDRRHTRHRRLAWILAGLTPVVFVGWVVLSSPVLSVRDVLVSGQSRLSKAEVLAAAAVVDGTPLARLDVGGIATRITRLAPVASVQVSRSWPHTVKITVVERRPVVAVPRKGGSFLLLDAQGAPVVTVRALPAGVLRLLVASPSPSDPTTQAALDVLTALPPSFRARLGSVSAASPEQVELTLLDGRKVLWGGVEDTVAKAAAVVSLIRLPGTIYDVSAPGVVTRR